MQSILARALAGVDAPERKGALKQFLGAGVLNDADQKRR